MIAYTTTVLYHRYERRIQFSLDAKNLDFNIKKISETKYKLAKIVF